MAVSASDNGIKILANAGGLQLLRSLENRSFIPESVTKVVLKNLSDR